MSIEKTVTLEKVEVFPNGIVQVSYRNIVAEDGSVLAESTDTKVINPGDDYSDMPALVITICNALS